MGWAVGLLVAVWLGIAAWAAVWALRSRRALAQEADARAAASAAEVDLRGTAVDLTAHEARVEVGDDDARRA